MKTRCEKLRKALIKLKPYIRPHATYCAYDDSMSWGDNPEKDFCTCNYKEVVANVEKAIQELEKAPPKIIPQKRRASGFGADFGDDYTT